jgi:predicted  nucleic acid-binding Zn-ribbon protein
LLTQRKEEDFLDFSNENLKPESDENEIEKLEEEIRREKEKQRKLNKTLTMSVETYKKLQGLVKLKEKNDELLDILLNNV